MLLTSLSLRCWLSLVLLTLYGRAALRGPAARS